MTRVFNCFMFAIIALSIYRVYVLLMRMVAMSGRFSTCRAGLTGCPSRLTPTSERGSDDRGSLVQVRG